MDKTGKITYQNGNHTIDRGAFGPVGTFTLYVWSDTDILASVRCFELHQGGTYVEICANTPGYTTVQLHGPTVAEYRDWLRTVLDKIGPWATIRAWMTEELGRNAWSYEVGPEPDVDTLQWVAMDHFEATMPADPTARERWADKIGEIARAVFAERNAAADTDDADAEAGLPCYSPAEVNAYKRAHGLPVGDAEDDEEWSRADIEIRADEDTIPLRQEDAANAALEAAGWPQVTEDSDPIDFMTPEQYDRYVTNT